MGRWCSLNCWVNILSFPCSSIACLRPSLFHAVQTYSQRQNKFPHDSFCSSYYSNQVKCYQTGIMLKISAKTQNPKTLQLKKAKKQETASPDFSSCVTHSPAANKSSCYFCSHVSFYLSRFWYVAPAWDYWKTPLISCWVLSPFRESLRWLCALWRNYNTWGI